MLLQPDSGWQTVMKTEKCGRTERVRSGARPTVAPLTVSSEADEEWSDAQQQSVNLASSQGTEDILLKKGYIIYDLPFERPNFATACVICVIRFFVYLTIHTVFI